MYREDMTPVCPHCGSEAIWHTAYSAQGIPFGKYWCSLCDCEVPQNVLIDGEWVEVTNFSSPYP